MTLYTEDHRQLMDTVRRFVTEELDPHADEWEAACVTIGKNVTVHVGERKFRGRAEALDDDGALLVRTQYGHLERIIGGDVMLEK